MKEIKAFVHKHRISAVIDALKAANILPVGHSDDVSNINVTTVQSLLKAVDATEQRYSMDLAESIIEEYKLEFLCEDGAADRLVQVVAMAGRTGQAEAGWVYVTSVESAIKIGGR
jgi:nitrogen regulatory protein P-II 1